VRPKPVDQIEQRLVLGVDLVQAEGIVLGLGHDRGATLAYGYRHDGLSLVVDSVQSIVSTCAGNVPRRFRSNPRGRQIVGSANSPTPHLRRKVRFVRFLSIAPSTAIEMRDG
jgi:hypothetical protein